MSDDDEHDLLHGDLFGGSSAASSGKKTMTTAAAFNPAAIFAPTMKKKATTAAGKKKDSVSSMGLDSLDSLLRTAKRQEKEVAAVARNAYKGLAGQEGGEEEEEEEEEGLEDLAALQALVQGALKKNDDASDSSSTKGKGKKKARQIFDDDDDEDDDDDGGRGGMEREEVGDWMGLASVFRMADAGDYPSLALPASLPEMAGWGADARRLKQALVDAEAKGLLPDLLCLMGPARWLQATDGAAPPGLLDWLLKAVAWHVDPAVSHGAARTLKGLFQGEDGLGPYRKGLGGWSLSFPLLQDLLAPYGVRLLPSPGVYASFLADATPLDTVGLPALGAAELRERERQLKMERTGVAPTVNLRGLLVALAWCLRSGRAAFAGQGKEMAALLYALLVLGIDRYVQADCPEELRGAVAATLHALPEEESWTAAIPAVLDALLPPQAAAASSSPSPQLAAVHLGTASALHIGRAALPALHPGRSGDRARQLLTRLLRRVIEERVLLPLSKPQGQPSPGLAALMALPTQTAQDKQAYLYGLLNACLSESQPPCPEAAAAVAPAGLNVQVALLGGEGVGEGTPLDRVLFLAVAVGMWAQLAGEGKAQGDKGSVVELAKKLTRLERGKLRNHAEEAVQSAKDILSQAAASVQALAPKGPTQMTLTSAFSRKSSGMGMEVEDDDE